MVPEVREFLHSESCWRGSHKGRDACFSESTAVGDGIQDRAQSPDFTDEYVQENEEPPSSTESPNSANLRDPLSPVRDNTEASLGNHNRVSPHLGKLHPT